MSYLHFYSRLFVPLLKRSKYATLHVTFPDGEIQVFGEGAPHIQVQVKSWEIFQWIWKEGDLGLAKAIIYGQLEVDQLAALVTWACRNEQEVSQTLHGTWFGTLFYRLSKMLKPNTKTGAKKNILEHYDLGNEFYKLWLDPTMTYSSAIFKNLSNENVFSTAELYEAQQQKYDRLIESLNIRSGDHILEVGCGWGGFFSRAVEKTGCKVTAVLNSEAQAAHNRDLIREKGFGANVELKEIDYRDISGKYDKIVSIEMIEAVGEKYWSAFFEKISSSLKTGGTAMIQAITMRPDRFDEYRKKTDFIQQYIFPGSMLLAKPIFEQQSEKNGLKLGDIFEFGISYAETLKVWEHNFTRSKDQILALGFDERFVRLWRLYLAYCEGAFRAERINVGHYALQK
jgi:cyclopropane-fatty-acyl-phospholipid synthase